MDVSTAFKQRSLMENNMKHALKNSINENMHGLLESSFVFYANQLRANYPGRTIRNARCSPLVSQSLHG
jgi:hypothetical protein